MTTLKSERARSTKGRLGLAEILVLLAGGGAAADQDHRV